MLKLVLPKGSLEKATLELFELADLGVRRSSGVDYKATIDDPRIDEVRILRPQEIPRYVAQGLFDIGITGRDWVEETASDVNSLGELKYSKATDLPIRVVLAVPGDSPWNSVSDLPQGVKVSSEYPEMTRRYFEKHGVAADIQLSYGATEAKVPDIVDVVVEGMAQAFWNNGEPMDEFPIDTGRLRSVVELAAAKAGWGKTLPQGEGLGIAVHRSFVSYIAAVVHAKVGADGQVRVPEAHIAIDAGFVANPERVLRRCRAPA